MPFVSKNQQRWMFANKPKMALEWAHKTSNIKELPEYVKKRSLKKIVEKHTGKGGGGIIPGVILPKRKINPPIGKPVGIILNPLDKARAIIYGKNK